MKQLYAIVSPAFTKSGDGFKDLPSSIVSFAYSMMYEQVCGYSLGHDVVFFESIENAKNYLEEGIKGSKSAAKTAAQKAIWELDANDELQITGFSKIHSVDVQKFYQKTENEGFFKPVRMPEWNDRAIDATKEATEGALEEMNRLYQESKKTMTEQVAI